MHNDDISIQRVHDLLGIEKPITPIPKEPDFDLSKTEPQFYTNLGLYRNAVNQCFKIDPATNQIIGSQADTNTPEGFFLSHLSPSGEYLSKMEIQGGGHGTLFGLDRLTDGKLSIWTWHEQLKKLIRFEYKENTVLTLSDASQLDDYTPLSLKNESCYVTFDPYHDHLIFFVNRTKEVQIRRRLHVILGLDQVIHCFPICCNEWNNDRPFQGGVAYGTDVYVLYGWGELESIPSISVYDAKTGKKKEEHFLDDVYGAEGIGKFQDNFREPEGLEFYVNPYNQKKSLLFCLTTGGHLKRYHNVYGYHQEGAEEHFHSIVKINSQNYAYTRSDGRAFQVLEEWNDLNEIFKVGYYYIKDDVFANYKNKPNYPVGTQGDGSWWLEVKPADQYWTVRQILTRLSYTPKNIQFERTISLGRNNVGDWNLVKSDSLVHPNYAQPTDWGNRIANIIVPDTYYITTPMSNVYSDHPEPNFSGWWLYVSTRSSDNRVEQRLTINNSLYFREYRRMVDVNTKQPVTEWKLIDWDKLALLSVET